ncbi:MAG: hypothetical protein KAI70_03625, partial [Candidatus Omnitrophica bacterium]|nr:hypothetical protein [Candidatus Omnitrophota bacterium]
TGIDKDTTYTVKVTITAPNESLNTALASIHTSGVSVYKTNVAANWNDLSGAIEIVTWLLRDNVLVAGVNVEDVEIKIGGTVLTEALTANADGTFGIETSDGIARDSTYIIESNIIHDGETYTATSSITTSRDVYNANINVVYMTSDVSLDIVCWLTKNSAIVKTDLDASSIAIKVDGIEISQAVTFEAGSGLFTVTKTDGIVTDNIYNVECVITYKGSEYMNIVTVRSYVPSEMGEVITGIGDLSTQVGNVQTSVTGVTEAINAVEETTAAVVSKTIDLEETIRVETGKILTATGTESMAIKFEEVKKEIRSGILTSINTTMMGKTVTITYGAADGLQPVIDVYDPLKVQLITAGKMKELAQYSGDKISVYGYDVTFLPDWGVGEFSIVCSEPVYETLDAISINVVGADLDQVSNTTSAILGMTAGISEWDATTDLLLGRFSSLEAAVTRLSGMVARSSAKGGAGGAASGGGAVDYLKGMQSNLKELSNQIKEMGDSSEYGLDQLYEVSEEKKEDMTYIKNKTQELKALMELNQKMIDNVANEPVIQTWYEYGSVIIKSIIINPSETQIRNVPYKAYLPKEVKPEHLLSLGELNVAYDTQQGSYYVFANFKLKPKEAKEIEIEMEDIWKIDENEMVSLMDEAEKAYGILENTEFSTRSKFLFMGIKDRLNKIIIRQKDAPVNPEDHISGYRENLRMLEASKEDLTLMGTLVSQVKMIPVKVTGKLILAIVLFLGILSLGCYFVWQKQLKLTEVPTFENEEKTEDIDEDEKDGDEDEDEDEEGIEIEE